MAIKKAWGELSNAWLEKDSCSFHIKDLEALFVWSNLWNLYYNKNLKYIFDQKELNLCQWKWMELVKDYDYSILCHPNKANVVANALSKKVPK